MVHDAAMTRPFDTTVRAVQYTRHAPAAAAANGAVPQSARCKRPSSAAPPDARGLPAHSLAPAGSRPPVRNHIKWVLRKSTSRHQRSNCRLAPISSNLHFAKTGHLFKSMLYANEHSYAALPASPAEAADTSEHRFLKSWTLHCCTQPRIPAPPCSALFMIRHAPRGAP